MVLDRSKLHPNDLMRYPRTPHLPESEGMTSDDKMASKKTLEYLASGIELVTSVKMDGGNLTWSRTHFHGRSIDSGTNVWDSRARALYESVKFDIPEGWRISGESMQARRSVSYDNLPGVFMVFGIWDETNTLLDWDTMTEWANLLNLPVVPVIYRGTDLKEARTAWAKIYSDDISEGFVIRDAGRIAYADFAKRFAKRVRANHVRTNDDWRHRDDFAVNTFAS